MLKKKLLQILKKKIRSFDGVEKYKLIGTFGSVINDREPFDDFDLITIGGNSVHKRFLNSLKNELESNGFNVFIFKTIKRKPKKRSNRDILIHDLHYKNITDLSRREWKGVVESIKLNTKIFYGSKSTLDKIPKSNINWEDIINPCRKWLNEIRTKNEFDVFGKYLKKITPLLTKKYSKLDLANLEKACTVINKSSTDWSTIKKEIGIYFKKK